MCMWPFCFLYFFKISSIIWSFSPFSHLLSMPYCPFRLYLFRLSSFMTPSNLNYRHSLILSYYMENRPYNGTSQPHNILNIWVIVIMYFFFKIMNIYIGYNFDGNMTSFDSYLIIIIPPSTQHFRPIIFLR